METVDALIVGGGPAGSVCARDLRHAGLRVLLLDKAHFPRDKPCAGWVTPQVFESLGITAQFYGANRTCQEIRGFRCSLLGQQPVEISYPEPVSYGIRRCEFDTYLLQRAAVATRMGKVVTKVERRDSCWILNDEFAAPLLIGAGGHFCPIARRLGAQGANTGSTVFAKEIEFRIADQKGLSCSVAPELPELYFLPDLSGYGWCFRKGPFLNVGLGCTSAHKLSGYLQQFCEYLQRQGIVRGDMPASFRGHAYRLHDGSAARLVDEGVLLIGDAANLAYAHSGEGIRPAIESGILAAEVIVQADGNASSQALSAYPRRLQQRFGTPTAEPTRSWLIDKWRQFAAGLLMAQPWFVRRVVVESWLLHRWQKALRPAELATPDRGIETPS